MGENWKGREGEWCRGKGREWEGRGWNQRNEGEGAEGGVNGRTEGEVEDGVVIGGRGK